MSMSKCARELKKLDCTINYDGQRGGIGASRDGGSSLLKLL